MLLIGELTVWLYEAPVDMRKSIDGLSIMVAEKFGKNPASKNEIFLFYNRMANKLKLLFWNRNGFCLFYKRLEKGRFFIPKSKIGYTISAEQLKWLLDGLDITHLKEPTSLKYSEHF